MLVLGELEVLVLEHLWSRGPEHVKSVFAALGVRRGIKLNTVQSTMERLYRKNLLSREKVSHAFVYRAEVTREQLSTRVIGEAVDQLSHGQTNVMLSAFVSLAEKEGEQALVELEELIAKSRANARREKNK
ncbi:BlaI/MecI/CopY family transcriptional regulator [Endomicrobium sp. AH-315-J14]|nr:BlaI/MecI/CopY family transcriptional regulator [Endomicrobium sp. AH-315-J14]